MSSPSKAVKGNKIRKNSGEERWGRGGTLSTA